MTIFQKINLIPDLINEKKLTETQAVNYICTQLLKNPKTDGTMAKIISLCQNSMKQ